jgi:protease PrsW
MRTQVEDDLSRWTWLKVLVGGAVSFFLIERALIATGNINYVPSLLLVGTFTVPAAYCLFLYSRSRQPQVHFLSLAACAIWGGILGSVLAGYLEYHALLTLGTLPTIAIGVIEELAKVLVPVYFILRFRYRSELDGIIMGVAAGAGFAILESMGYALVALLSTFGNIEAVNQVILSRSISSSAVHIAWTGLLAGAVWHARFSNDVKRRRNLFLTFVGVCVLHGLWDSIDFTAGYILLGILSLAWLFARAHKASKSVAVIASY